MDKPMCKLCRHRHWGSEHVLPKNVRGSDFAYVPDEDDFEDDTHVPIAPVTVTRTVSAPKVITPAVTPGEPCPTCGHVVPLGNKLRQQKFRERQRG